MFIKAHTSKTDGSSEIPYRERPLAVGLPNPSPNEGANARTGSGADVGSHVKNLGVYFRVNAKNTEALSHFSPSYAPTSYISSGTNEDEISFDIEQGDGVLVDIPAKGIRGPNDSTYSPNPSLASVSMSPYPSTDSSVSSDDNFAMGVTVKPNTESVAVTVKRQRGRPPKGTTAPVPSPQSRTKGKRTKTGCWTCRLRKKKCDERKPICSTCDHNNYQCKYPERRVFAPGIKKSLPSLNHPKTKESFMPSSDLRGNPSSMYPGIESELDYFLFIHYRNVVSSKITMNSTCDAVNPFVSLIIPLAVHDEGTMHSLLSLSSAHYYRSDPREDVWMHKQQHRQKASAVLHKDFKDALKHKADVHKGVVAGLVLQTVLSLVDEEFPYEYRRRHLEAKRYVVWRDADPLHRWAKEFFDYFEMSLVMTSFDRDPLDRPSLIGLEGSLFLPPLLYKASISSSSSELCFAVQETVTDHVYDGIMRKVLGSLFPLISEITSLRDGVRLQPLEYQDDLSRSKFYEKGLELEVALYRWDSQQEDGTKWCALAELYRDAAFVYLHRTVLDPTPCRTLSERVRKGINLLEWLRSRSRSTDCVLLLPTFILGCAAFAVDERRDITSIMQALAESNNFNNIQPSMRILRELWAMMDLRDKRNWDWETVRARRRTDYAII